MKAEYRRLGDYIRQVDVRNKEQKVDLLLGLSIEKKFIPSIANTIGTDMSSYKIVEPMQFAYVPVTSRNGDKITIALYKGGEKAIISQAYTVFEVTDTDTLMQDYLMLWFLRPEFDRYARFKSHGSAREVFDWDEMCNVMLPVPPIEEQRRIVEQYQTVERRIKNNERLIALLEDTAQTIFRHRFVENIDPNNLPEGWRMGTVGELFELQRGYDLPEQARRQGTSPIYASTGICGYHNEYKVSAPGVVTGRSGTIGKVMYVHDEFWPLNTTLYIKDASSSSFEFAYYKLQELQLDKTVAGFAAVPTLNRNDVHAMASAIPPTEEIRDFSIKARQLLSEIKLVQTENELLSETKQLLISRL